MRKNKWKRVSKMEELHHTIQEKKFSNTIALKKEFLEKEKNELGKQNDLLANIANRGSIECLDSNSSCCFFKANFTHLIVP